MVLLLQALVTDMLILQPKDNWEKPLPLSGKGKSKIVSQSNTLLDLIDYSASNNAFPLS